MQISVIMAVYNNDNAKILKTAVDSILQQTFADFELIICDDASTDGTYDLLKKIAKTDCRIRLLRNELNLKAGGARNECLKVAKGDFIAIMDSDDISHPKRLEKEAEFLKKHMEFDFVGTRGQFFVNNIESGTGHYWFCKEPKNEDFLMTLPFVHGSILFRKKSLDKVKGYSANRITMRIEDYDMLMRMYARNMKGANINEVLYYIRRDESTYSRRKYRYRFNEAIVKCKRFYDLGLLLRGLPYALKPLLVGLVQIKLLNKMKDIYYKDK